MAKELYVGKILTDEMIIAGERFLQHTQAVMPITAAFWLYMQEIEAWRLHLITPLMITQGPRKVYDKLLNVLDTHQEHKHVLPATCLRAAEEDNPYIKSLRMMPLSHTFLDQRLTNVGLPGGCYIEDTYIYRLYEAEGVQSEALSVAPP
jgi:hypothetical protein